MSKSRLAWNRQICRLWRKLSLINTSAITCRTHSSAFSYITVGCFTISVSCTYNTLYLLCNIPASDDVLLPYRFWLYCLLWPALIGQILHFAWLQLTIPLPVAPIWFLTVTVRLSSLLCNVWHSPPVEWVSITVCIAVPSCLSLLCGVFPVAQALSPVWWLIVTHSPLDSLRYSLSYIESYVSLCCLRLTLNCSLFPVITGCDIL